MHKLFDLVRPGWDEVLLYTFMALCLLFVFNIPGFWEALLSSANTDSQTAQSFGQAIKTSFSHITRLSDPQIVNAFVWGITAALGLGLAVMLADFIRAEADDERIIRQRDGVQYFFTRLCLRIAAFLGLLAYGALFFAILLPSFLRVFLSAVVHPLANNTNILLALGALVATSASLYFFAIMIRLLLLRVRVLVPYVG